VSLKVIKQKRYRPTH